MGVFAQLMLMTRTMRIRCDIALHSLQCFSNGPMHTASVFHSEFTDIMILSLYYPFHHVIFCVILCCNWVETAILFTIFMIQCVFSILIYSFNLIWDVLAPIYMPLLSEDKWKSIAGEFYERWNFPNGIGAIDGKHVMIQCPKFTGWASAS